MITELEATKLRNGRYAIRPKGCLGTCGWIDNIPWSVTYVNAHCEQEAINKAKRLNYGYLSNPTK